MIIKEYIKDKIDWKFFNALMDKLTKYEDSGINCSLTVYLYSRKTRLRLVEYFHYKLSYSSLVSTDVERIIERGMHMMTYTIKMDDKKADNEKLIQEFSDSINNKKYGYNKIGNGKKSLDFQKVDMSMFESKNEVLSIEDLLVYFEDKDEIAAVSVKEYKNSFEVYFRINNNIIGYKRAELMTNIFSRLKKKYKYLYLGNNNVIVIEKEEPSPDTKNWAEHNYTAELNKFINSKLSGLNRYKSREHLNLMFYGKSEQDLLFAYYKVGDSLFVDYNKFWLPLKVEFQLEHTDIRSIIKTIATEKLHIKVIDINHGIPQRPQKSLIPLEINIIGFDI